MNRIALQMLRGDTAKFFGILFGLSFAALLITQQMSIFVGLMSRTFWFLEDTGQADVWVMDQAVRYIDEVEPMRDTALQRVRSTAGVEWAVPLYTGQVRARMTTGDFRTLYLVGLDDASLLGGPPIMIEGRLADLRRADAVFVDEISARTKLRQPVRRLPDGRPDPSSGTRPMRLGDQLEINDQRAVVAGICRNTRSLLGIPVVYTTYSRARGFVPPTRKQLSYIMVKSAPGKPPKETAALIAKRTGLKARTRNQFIWDTIDYYMANTGIPINFGIAVALGFLVGTAIAGQTFYNFTLDNIRYFGALKAMGASNFVLLRMVMLQALYSGFAGFGIGLGLTSLFGTLVQDSPLAFRMLWQIAVFGGVAIAVICTLSAVVSMIKVLRLEPAVVFQG